MTFYHVAKSPRRWLVMMANTVSHTSGHTMQSLGVLCETDSPQLVPWLLKGVCDARLPLFARQLLDAAALAGEGEAILAKCVPWALYTGDKLSPPRVRVLWDALKDAINRYPLANHWQWSPEEMAAAKAIEAAFGAFLAAREGKP